MSKTRDFLKNFLSRTNIPGLGTREGRQAKYDESKKSLFGQPLPEYGVSEFLQMPDRSKAIERQRKEKEKEEKPELGDSFDQDKYFKELRGLQAQQSILRDYELGREANRQFAMMQRTLPLVDLYSETAAKRRLMEDQFSPTKISQQRLRAQTGEATLMQAIASQGSTAAQIGNIGTSRRYGR
tara:strand:+ start:78 stop:626 length:549 start_codon:yes stop_codon:yes gene_type:complete